MRKWRTWFGIVALALLALVTVTVAGNDVLNGDVRGNDLASLDVSPIMTQAQLTKQYCDDTFAALENAAQSNDLTSAKNIWNQMTSDWQNGFIAQCGGIVSIADSCQTLALKQTLVAGKQQKAIANAMSRKNCVAGYDQSVLAKTNSCNLIKALDSLEKKYVWDPSLNVRYKTDRALFDAQMSYATVLESDVVTMLAHCNSCDELEQAMEKKYSYLDAAQPNVQDGLDIYAHNLIYGRFVSNHCLTALVRGTAQNASATGAVALSSDIYAVPSSATGAVITILHEGSRGVGSVRYQTSDGSAHHDLDYTTTQGLISFIGGETSKSFTIPLQPNLVLRGSKTLTVTLSDPTGNSVLYNPATATLYIQGYGAKPPKERSSAAASGAASSAAQPIVIVTSSSSSTGSSQSSSAVSKKSSSSTVSASSSSKHSSSHSSSKSSSSRSSNHTSSKIFIQQ